MAKKRRFTTFSLSFLDIMSCGFGAVALIFLIIKHDVDTRTENQHPDLQAEVMLLEEEVLVGEENLVLARNTISDVDQRLAQAQGLARAINEDINAVRGSVNDLLSDDPSNTVASLQQQLEQLQIEKEKLEKENRDLGNDVRRFVGQGNRQYLTGLNLGGNYVAILLDSSASMLDDTIINIIRRKNMSLESKLNAEKWQKSLATVEWLIARLQPGTNYQIITFNTEPTTPLANSANQWLSIDDKAQLERVIDNLRNVEPDNGTNLAASFTALSQLDPLPDNIFLITDGLPTLGSRKPKKNTITASDRRKLYREAVELLPIGVPVNTILMPMEGDPDAAAAYWQLAQITRGSFLTPSADWP
jgi:hypothetical protein